MKRRNAKKPSEPSSNASTTNDRISRTHHPDSNRLAMAFRRNWLTGELEEYDSELDRGRQVVHAETAADGTVRVVDGPAPIAGQRQVNAYARPQRSKAMGVIPSQAAAMNEAAQQNGTGAFYDPKTGDAVFSSRRARSAEMQVRGMFDKQAGYGDYAGA